MPATTTPSVVGGRHVALVTRPHIFLTAMVKNLPSYALVFIAGFGVGFMYHHIASFATSEHALDSATRLRSVEARLAQIEARFGAHAADHSIAIADGSDGAVVVVDDGPKKSKARRRYEKAVEKATHALPHAGAKAAATMNHDIPGCPAGRKPYHVVLTAQDSTYQAWQTRIMVHHLQKHMRGNKCTEITGFTRCVLARLLSHPTGTPPSFAHMWRVALLFSHCASQGSSRPTLAITTSCPKRSRPLPPSSSTAAVPARILIRTRATTWAHTQCPHRPVCVCTQHFINATLTAAHCVCVLQVRHGLSGDESAARDHAALGELAEAGERASERAISERASKQAASKRAEYAHTRVRAHTHLRVCMNAHAAAVCYSTPLHYTTHRSQRSTSLSQKQIISS